MPGCKIQRKRLVGVATGQHGGETRNLFLAATLLTRLLVMPVGAHGAESAFAIQPLLQPAERLLDRLALLEFDLSQSLSLPSNDLGHMVECAVSGQGRPV
mgnify:CR=1 FL=1